MKEKSKLGVVGPCASGKSTLIASLNKYGYNARHIAQEHSYVPSMWLQITNPDVLIFLDVSYELSKQRRKLNWTEAEYAEQHYRLRHARQHADIYVDTNNLTAEQVLQRVLNFLGHPELPTL
jgi:ATPase subunit of ABC transporter with duplicated ATPase domains